MSYRTYIVVDNRNQDQGVMDRAVQLEPLDETASATRKADHRNAAKPIQGLADVAITCATSSSVRLGGSINRMPGQKTMTNQKLAKFALGNLSAILVAIAIAASPAGAAPKGTMASMNAPAQSNERAADAPFLVHGKRMDLQSFKGQPIMLWQVATWCGSCAVGLQTLAQNQALIDASNLKIIILRDYKNGGYPGVDMEKFVAANAPALLHDSHFIIGEDTEALFNRYNPHHYIDVYHLIEPNGDIAAVSSAPSMTFDKIGQFIKAKGKS